MCTQNTQAFGLSIEYILNTQAFGLSIEYILNTQTQTQILKKFDTHTQNPNPNTKKV